MTLTLTLPPELEQYLLQEADQQQISIAPLAPKAIEVMTLQILTQSALSRQKQIASVVTGTTVNAS